MRPPPANHQSGDDNLKHRQASPEHPATGSPGTPRARLAVRPPLKSHQSSIRATRTQLRTQNTMGTGAGSSDSVNSAVSPQHTFVIFPFYLSGHCFSAASSEEPDCRTYIGEKTKEATGFAHRRKHPGGIYLRSLYLLYLSVRSLPLDRICQIILFISA